MPIEMKPLGLPELDLPSVAALGLNLDCRAELQRISSVLREQVVLQLRRRGAVVALSGGIDSSVTAAICVHALGADRVLGLCLPEHESSAESRDLAVELAASLGIELITTDVTAMLEAAECYQLRDDAIRELVPSYGAGYKCKLVLSNIASGARYAIPSLIVAFPDGSTQKVKLNASTYLKIVAATNFKQRVRKTMEYYHADRLQYAVAGTPNRLEYDQGFFVKNGDGAADVKPIAHLYKSQVYELADYLGLPETIRKRRPTTDTFSMEQSQEEFFFGVPLRTLDLCLYARNCGLNVADATSLTGLTEEMIASVYDMIEAKRRATAYLHEHGLTVEPLSFQSAARHRAAVSD